jgi:hypothetical protein
VLHNDPSIDATKAWPWEHVERFVRAVGPAEVVLLGGPGPAIPGVLRSTSRRKDAWTSFPRKPSWSALDRFLLRTGAGQHPPLPSAEGDPPLRGQGFVRSPRHTAEGAKRPCVGPSSGGWRSRRLR